MDLDELLYRVPREAKPPTVFGYASAPDLASEKLLGDLADSHAWLARELKEPFLAAWVNADDFDNPDLDDPIVALDRENLFKFAAIDPVVDLESLRGRYTELS